MKFSVILLSLAAFAADQARYIAGPAKIERVTHEGITYIVTRWPLYCASQQQNECSNKVPTRRAGVVIDRENGERVSYLWKECQTDHCKTEPVLEWVKTALRDAK